MVSLAATVSRGRRGVGSYSNCIPNPRVPPVGTIVNVEGWANYIGGGWWIVGDGPIASVCVGAIDIVNPLGVPVSLVPMFTVRLAFLFLHPSAGGCEISFVCER